MLLGFDDTWFPLRLVCGSRGVGAGAGCSIRTPIGRSLFLLLACSGTGGVTRFDCRQFCRSLYTRIPNLGEQLETADNKPGGASKPSANTARIRFWSWTSGLWTSPTNACDFPLGSHGEPLRHGQHHLRHSIPRQGLAPTTGDDVTADDAGPQSTIQPAPTRNNKRHPHHQILTLVAVSCVYFRRN